MPAHSSPRPDHNAPARPVATDSLHAGYLESALPQWLIDASAQRKTEIKNAGTRMPAWYTQASAPQRQTLDDSFRASLAAQSALDQTMSSLKDIDAFARPILTRALKRHYKVNVDVDKTVLSLKRPLALGLFNVEIGSFEVLSLTMLQAALHNFELRECMPGAFHKSSGFGHQTSPGTYAPAKVNLTVTDFLRLCRKLDIGAQYQAHLKAFFHTTNPYREKALREQFVACQKSALRAAAEQALLAGDIRPADHAMIVSVIEGEQHPRMGDRHVWFHDLGLMKIRLVGCVVFVIGRRRHAAEAAIVYVPHDPEHPLKRYTGTQMNDMFKRLLTTPDAQSAQNPAPTSYQRFFSQFLPYDQRAYFFSQFVRESADTPLNVSTSLLRRVPEAISPLSPLITLRELPPEHPWMEPEPDPYIGVTIMPLDEHDPWAQNSDLWDRLYELHRDKVLADARSHAVPSKDVDVKARDARLAALLQVGLLALNLVSMFVPVLGEIMMVVMAGQLLYETFEGAVEWSEGDKHAAKAHLVDVAENLALIAAMSAGGALFSKLTAVAPEPVIEDMHPVTLPNGETRLWKPDLSGYEQDISLKDASGPDEAGQYRLNGKNYIRQGDKVYELVVDRSASQWRIKHPGESNAYQPVVQHNGRGAWRHTLEQPMRWNRLELLRRMGHVTDGFSDESLLALADVSGVSESTLRKMHMDHAPAPPELRDAMRLFKADAQIRQMVEQLRGETPVDQRYLQALPRVTDMPRWPDDRVLEIFSGTELAGPSIRYGAEKLVPGVSDKAPIQLTRAQILNGELPARILAALEENEINYLLGRDTAQFRPGRAEAFSRQLADHLATHQASMVDELYRGTEPVNPHLRMLQRATPGLSEAAAQDVLDHATAAELARLQSTGRAPLKMLEEARWHVFRGRQTRAFAGLHSDNLASADSRRLALHALAKLPGWPKTLRLEIREGSPTGTLLDSLGEATAPNRQYLIKDGPFYQAFDARREPLGSASREADSFYRAIMRVLHDDEAAALGLTDGTRSHELQRKVIESAREHRVAAAQLLAPRASNFKAPTRINATLSGYYASGRGTGLRPSLVVRLMELYPGPRQAEAFLSQQRDLNDRQIYSVLEARRREWNELNAALEQWQAGPSGSQATHGRSQVALALREAWRNAPLAGQDAEAARLLLVCDEPLPELTGSFAHVRELSVTGDGMTDTNADAFLGRFPEVTHLAIGNLQRGINYLASRPRPLTAVPSAVGQMPRLVSLRFSTHASVLASDFPASLGALTSLETLHIDYAGFDARSLHALDLSALHRLRNLRIDAPYALWEWPAYTERLAQLQRLDLSHTAIRALPDSLYNAQERLWAGLSLDWAALTPAQFMRAYQYVRNYSGELGHLVDLNQMVSQYCRAELDFMATLPDLRDPLPASFDAAWVTPEARMAAIARLRAEHDAIFAQFHEPTSPERMRVVAPRWQWATGRNAGILRALKQSWNAALRQHYGVPADIATFELPEPSIGLIEQTRTQNVIELPGLPAGSFPHVRTLRLGQLDVTVEQARAFVRGFSASETLVMNGGTFTELPWVAADLPALRQADLSGNRIVVTAAVQAQFNGLQRLGRLNLQGNPLGQLDVSAMRQLQALNLRATGLRAWPAGAESLERLYWLDLRDNSIASLPAQALADPHALMKVNLSGNAFSPEGQTALNSAMQRIERVNGLAEGTLARFAAEPVPADSLPRQSAWTLTELLLALPERSAVAPGEAGRLTRLRDLHPGMSQERAARVVQTLRESGLSDEQIDAQIGQWLQHCEALTRQLNDWLYTRGAPAGERRASAQSRSRAALRIREAWLTGLSQNPGEEGLTLNLGGLQTGDLPSLVQPLPAVRVLDASGLGMTGPGANGFLQGFANLRRLIISGNELLTVPDAVMHFQQLERLDMQYCGLFSAASVYPLLGGARLRWLDLSYNDLQAFNPPRLGAIETLDLRFNELADWPDAVLDAPNLRTLNLSGNDITDIPEALFDGHHARLMAGTDVSENTELSLDALQRLRFYGRVNHLPEVLGIAREDIDAMIDAQVFGVDESGVSDIDHDSNGVAEEGEASDPHAQVEPVEEISDSAYAISPAALSPWLADSPALAATRRALWTHLAQEPNHEPFFQLISFLRHTGDFRFARAELTQRLWRVMQAASDNTELRELMFHNAEVHGTCSDGRILTFSELETRAYQYTALRDLPRDRLDLRGRALLDMTRRLFRLERVDRLAEAAGVGLDRAEIRLRYRIGLTRGWPDGLELPGQPEHMLYGTPITGQRLQDARAAVLADEASSLFIDDLISRDYWADYLKERYPAAFDELERDAALRHEQIEDADAVGAYDEQYLEAMNRLQIELALARAVRLKALSRSELQMLAQVVVDVPQPAPSSPQPGPSRRQ
ncbi:NEL-type E3 ubiquitin ligase domain-containing protein [Pseudomonas retamae]|uniref:RING-type E3 ubiquitin transferase n=1 Tax=Pseudomonas retamae TaxID=702110 RepID=A0ABW7D718_9PSED